MVAGFKSNIQALCTRELLDDHEEEKEKPSWRLHKNYNLFVIFGSIYNTL